MKRPSRRLKTRLLTIGMIVIFGMAALSPLSPEAEGRAVSIHDIAEGEPPRRKVPDNNGGYRFMFVPNAACAVGVMLRPDRPGCHAAASALYFDLPERIEWLPVFRSVTPEPYTAQLI